MLKETENVTTMNSWALSSYPFHKVIERVEGKVEIEGLHRVEQPLRVQIGPPNSRPEHPVEMDTSKHIPF